MAVYTSYEEIVRRKATSGKEKEQIAIFQGQAVTARDKHQDFSFCCHFVLLFEIESVFASAVE